MTYYALFGFYSDAKTQTDDIDMNVTSPLDLSTMPVTGMSISPGKVLYFCLA